MKGPERVSWWVSLRFSGVGDAWIDGAVVAASPLEGDAERQVAAGRGVAVERGAVLADQAHAAEVEVSAVGEVEDAGVDPGAGGEFPMREQVQPAMAVRLEVLAALQRRQAVVESGRGHG